MKLQPATTAFVFPGQGSQSVGMGKELAAAYQTARQVFEQADAILGFSLSRLMWEGPEADLNDTVNTQPALYVHSIAAWKTFLSLFPEFQPARMAGHSLGELSALTAAGALAFEDGLRLVRRRGELMKRAGELAPGGMAAILGLDIPILEKICSEASHPGEPVQVANDNCPGQVVISGAKAAVERAIELAKNAGARRAIPLAVSIAAHSPLMATIQGEWGEAVAAAPIGDAQVTVVGNVQAMSLRQAQELREDLLAQMQGRVRWTESVRNMIGNGIRSFVEVGSGSVLIGLIRRIDSSVATFSLGNPGDFQAFLE
ncbi:MAG: ACP S-malonyltransferase [Anaerolineae bacterium]